MDKITLTPFGEVTNYLQLMEQAPAVFARIVMLETKLNELIDKENVRGSYSAVAKTTPATLPVLSGNALPKTEDVRDSSPIPDAGKPASQGKL